MTTLARLDQLPQEQRAFHAAVVSACSHVASHFSVETGDDGQPAIFARIPSPTGDESRGITIWVDAGDISVEFDIWHTHAELCYAIGNGECLDLPLTDVVALILRDEFLVMLDGDPANKGWDIWMPAHGDARLVDFLTEPHGSGTAEIRSWSGTKDRRTSVADVAEMSQDFS